MKGFWKFLTIFAIVIGVLVAIVIIVGVINDNSYRDNAYHQPEAKVIVNNRTGDTYQVVFIWETNGQVYEDDEFTLSGYAFKEKKIYPGDKYSIYVTQMDGYLILPRKNNYSIKLKDGEVESIYIE